MEANGALNEEIENKNPQFLDGVPNGSIGKSKNINSNTDFFNAGSHTANTKHVPRAVRRGY